MVIYANIILLIGLTVDYIICYSIFPNFNRYFTAINIIWVIRYIAPNVFDISNITKNSMHNVLQIFDKPHKSLPHYRFMIYSRIRTKVIYYQINIPILSILSTNLYTIQSILLFFSICGHLVVTICNLNWKSHLVTMFHDIPIILAILRVQTASWFSK